MLWTLTFYVLDVEGCQCSLKLQQIVLVILPAFILASLEGVRANFFMRAELAATEPFTLGRWDKGSTTVPFGDSPSSYVVLSDFAAVVTYARKTVYSIGHRVRVFTATYVTVKNDFLKLKKMLKTC